MPCDHRRLLKELIPVCKFPQTQNSYVRKMAGLLTCSGLCLRLLAFRRGLAALSGVGQWLLQQIFPSGLNGVELTAAGTVPDLHRIPFCARCLRDSSRVRATIFGGKDNDFRRLCKIIQRVFDL